MFVSLHMGDFVNEKYFLFGNVETCRRFWWGSMWERGH
jgi:hypothetical protein